MNLFPAVLLGGPPHAGKSVLTYTLTQALRSQQVDHYVLRACPDGEGDWSNEAAQELVRLIRVKGDYTSAFVERIARDLARRHLPLLVDVGGRPGPLDTSVFNQCTHAVLLYKEPADLDLWRELMDRHGITLLAEILSLPGPAADHYIADYGTVLRGAISGLERGTTAHGPLVGALVERLASLFAYSPDELRTAHLAAAPVETVIELDRLGQTLGLTDAQNRWSPHHLPKVLDYLPAGIPLGLYGRGPNWLYAALALHAHPAELFQFDPRLGWIAPLRLVQGEVNPAASLQAQVIDHESYTRLEFSIQATYLDYDEVIDAIVPKLLLNQGIMLSGRLPHWLWTGLVLVYWGAPWQAVYYPQLGQGIVVGSEQDALPVGALVK
ncbi:MAG: hypothetical protein A2Z04_06555 [Chloroflexi bacterium RBG_16_57_9]|nr:MAG: hypothetical protein A2Z04_06555 [Chloroflexi bacterium RBG_16_57_9]